MREMANDSTAWYVSWEEKATLNGKGLREVHYYLKSGNGKADLVVVGKEKGDRLMSYCYAIKDDKSPLSNLKRPSILKLRSKRDVINWLNSVVSGEQNGSSFRQLVDNMEGKLGLDNTKENLIQSVSLYRPEFRWIGSPLVCRKKRRHYQSFCRNGVIISVQDFVYVLAEENKRLVAYLDDMYEDSRGSKMVVVRWFHRIDEVGFVLPHNYNDREIFFSLCLQDLSVECIDGQATVLSPEHFEKFKNEETQMRLTPFVCYRQFDNDGVTPFDITNIKGYWKQDLLRRMYSSSSNHKPFVPKLNFSLDAAAVGCRPYKRFRRCNESDDAANKRELAENLQVCSGISVDSKCGKRMSSCSNASLSDRDDAVLPSCHHLTIGSLVEVLSQDSGMRGCWFRAMIVKQHKDKVKVQYQDIKDAVDDAKNLEEWILASRLAAPDSLGIRVSGRAMVRPSPLPNKERVPCVLNLGSIVDAWWHDGWWEGIVVRSESKDKLRVYFPGEKQEQIFSPVDLRESQEWVDNGWNVFKDRPELVSELHEQKTLSSRNKRTDVKNESGWFSKRDPTAPRDNDDLPQVVLKISDFKANNDVKMPSSENARDLSKDDLLAQLRWKSSGKRRRSRNRSPVRKWHYSANGATGYSGLQTFDDFLVDTSLTFNRDNCKYGRDSHFTSSVMSSLTSLVMSR